MDTKVEIRNADGIWDDISAYLALDQHSSAKRSRVGPNRLKRRMARRARVKSLPLLLDTYGPCANPTIAAVRAQTALNERDRAERAHRGAGGTAPLHPNRRLATFGMRVQLDERAPDGYRLVGGTARQQRCYRRAVERWLTSDAIAEAGA